MSREFARIYQDIFDSSLAENRHHRWIFADLLVLAGSSPYVKMSPRQIAYRIKAPLEDVTEAINAFLAPDPDSRSKEFEGRRIEPIDPGNENAGYFILNWDKWKEQKSQESKEARRRYKTEKQREYRAGKKRDADGHKITVFTESVKLVNAEPRLKKS